MDLRAISVILITVILGTALAGCGDTNAQSSSPQPVSEAQATQPPALPTDTPVPVLAVTEESAASTPAPTTAEAVAPTEAATDPSGPAATEPEAEAAVAKLNLNTTPGEAFLAAIPGMGNRMVREFEEYRPYISIRQFRQEIGKYVNQEQVAEYEKYVYVPIAINDADAATLQQISGLDDAEAEAMIAGRPYASADVFLTALAGYVSEAELTTAKTYLSEQ
jgi:DNA uptake protein ComE-like DNA-binding protein